MRTTLVLGALSAFYAVIAGAAATTPAFNATYKHFDCGVSQAHGSAHFNKTIKALHESNSGTAHTGSHKANIAQRQASQITVPTVYHVITKVASAGSITQAMVNAQIAAQNKVYSTYGITFNLTNTTFTANDAWAVANGTDMTDLKTALRQGTYDTLNLYFHTDLAGDILGTCSLPTDIGPGTPNVSTYITDGCNVQANTMPGGDILGYNTGMTAVHETGHWMGLLHVFEGYACTGDGDSIADTPMQSTSTDGCPTKPAKDSCPTVAGVDAIHNYMDYSTDVCYEQFTPLQVQRMQDLWAQYREGR